jgi:glycosyltransferase involved in cell wall biosynthesis
VPGASGEIWLLDHGEIAGGGQGLGFRLARALGDRGFDVSVGCRSDIPLARWCARAGIEVEDMRFGDLVPWRAFSVVPAVARTRRFLRRVGPDALVVGNHPRVHAHLYAATRGMGSAPAMVNLAHDQDSARRRSARYVYRRFGALLAVGSNAAGEYRARLPGVPVTKMNNFLPADDFDEARGRRILSPSYTEPALGVLARLIPEKGIAELVDRLASDEARGGWRSLIVGGAFQDASYTRAVEGRVGELGLGDRIRLLGEVEDVPGFLGSIDALVVPSTGNEAQPTVILEGLAHGVPVIVRESLVSHDYDDLPVVPYANASDLARILRDLPTRPAPVDQLIRRFGPDQAVAALESAAQAAKARS